MAHSYIRKRSRSALRSDIEPHGENKYGKGGRGIGWAKHVLSKEQDEKRRALVEKMNNKRKEK